jgi:hypothetical protein
MSSIKKQLYDIQYIGFSLFILISYTLIFLTTLGLSKNGIVILKTLDYYVRIYICLFLIYRFNPLRNVEFTELDRKIAFSAGLFLFTTSALNEYIQNLQKYMKGVFHNYKNKIQDTT